MNMINRAVCLAGAVLVAMMIPSFDGLRAADAKGAPQQHGATEIEFDEGVPMPPPVRPVIILSGTDYDIGYQYFQQLVQIFGTSLPSYQYDVEAVYRRDKIHRNSYSSGEMCALHKFETAIKAHAPEWIDIMRGMADGATANGVNINYTDLLYHYAIFERMADWGPKTLHDSVFKNDSNSDCDLGVTAQDATSLLQKERDAKFEATCSGFAAWGATTRDGKLIAAGSGDDSEGSFSATVVVFPKTGNNYITEPFNLVGFGGFPNHPSMNNRGLVNPHHGGSSYPGKEQWTFNAVPRGIANMHTIRFANNADEAYKLHMSYSPGSNNLGTAAFYVDVNVGKNDSKQHAFVVEGRDPLGVRHPGDNGEGEFIYATNNWFSDNFPKRGGTKVPHAGYWHDDSWYWWSISRNKMMYEFLSGNQGKVDADFIKMMYRYPSKVNEARKLEDIDATYRNGNGSDYTPAIGSTDNSTIAIAIPDDGNNGVYYVSTGPIARQTGPAYPGAHLYQPDKTFSWFQLRLAEDPRAVTEAARAQARQNIDAAKKELSTGRLKSTVAQPLREILRKAENRLAEGEDQLRDAAGDNKADGKNAVYGYSKATRLFTAAQAYANQVYEALIPPPIPSDPKLARDDAQRVPGQG